MGGRALALDPPPLGPLLPRLRVLGARGRRAGSDTNVPATAAARRFSSPGLRRRAPPASIRDARLSGWNLVGRARCIVRKPPTDPDQPTFDAHTLLDHVDTTFTLQHRVHGIQCRVRTDIRISSGGAVTPAANFDDWSVFRRKLVSSLRPLRSAIVEGARRNALPASRNGRRVEC